MSGVISGCAVKPHSPPDMGLAVSAGDVLFGNTEVSVAGGTATIGAADATNPRIDLVAIHSDGSIVVTAGAAAASPVAPAAVGTDQVVAYVFVPANATAITDHYVGDRRKSITGGVTSVAGKTGVVTLVPADAGVTVTAAPADLTDNTGGAPVGTLVVPRTDTLAHLAADVAANEASLNAYIESIVDALQTAGVLS